MRKPPRQRLLPHRQIHPSHLQRQNPQTLKPRFLRLVRHQMRPRLHRLRVRPLPPLRRL
jgi:hypothetical protein